MFAGRYRHNSKKEPKSQNHGFLQQESNNSKSLDMEEPNSLPSTVTETMSMVRLTWDFMTNQEVLYLILVYRDPLCFIAH